jgi:cytochrome c oxidase subunit 2
VQKGWSFLFGGVTAAAVGLFLLAPLVGWWLPKNVSTFGDRIDNLFYIILWITGFFFILVECLLVYFLYKYAGRPQGQEHVFGHHYAEKKVFWTAYFKAVARPVTAVIHDQHRLELFWTLVPALILLFIALVQINTWADIKYHKNMPSLDGQTQQLEVSARQFEWRIRYPSTARLQSWRLKEGEEGYERPGDFGRNPHVDDVRVVDEIHVYKGQKVRIYLTTQDVLHSFYLPNLRLKQDAVPGKPIPVWFEATEANTRYDEQTGRWVDGYDPQTGTWDQPSQVWELACAELCGWGHYKMQGRLYVHEDEADFLAWLQAAEQEQRRTQPPESTKLAAQ